MISRLGIGLALASLTCSGAATPDSDQLQIRLTVGITSYAPAGAEFRARVIGPLLTDEPVLPRGTIVHGQVRRVRAVGLGFRRERASLELDFTSCETPAGRDIPCRVELVGIDNARETVGAENRINGILAASHPHSWLNGVWYRPAPSFAGRAMMGLTGTAGVLQSRLAPTPIGAGLVFASKLAMVRMPEPEIVLPPGTELIVRVERIGDNCSPDVPPDAISISANPRVGQMPFAVETQAGKAVADVVNLAFSGSEDAITSAFEAAGWSTAEPRRPRTVARTYAAYTSMRSYPTAPVSALLHEGRLPDLVFQKSFNSVAKRHHIRLWKTEAGGEPLFAAAATHDVGIGFRWTRFRLTHEIDPEVDRERTKVINDLQDAGCIETMESVDRPELARSNAEGGLAVTDGKLYVLRLRTCLPQDAASQRGGTPRRRGISGATRRIVLEARQYFIRGNVLYVAARGLRSAFRPRSERRAYTAP